MAELNLKQIIDRLNAEFTGETRKEDETLEVYTIRGEARAAYLVVNAPAEYYSTL